MLEKNNADYNETGEEEKIEKIMKLNDHFRQTLQGGQVMFTRGAHDLGEDMVRRILIAVQNFSDFKADNDPYGEHDFEAVTVDGVKCFFKIDYFDKELKWGSPDASDPAVTTRVMTIMKAEEY